MSIRDVAEFVSLILTIPTLILAAAVVWVWGPRAIEALKGFPRMDAQGWFITGVASGFAGGFLDNLYWMIPWTASFFDCSFTGELMAAGVFFNIFSRQGLGIFAAYCHLRAGSEAQPGLERKINLLIGLSYASSVLASIALLIAREVI